MSSASLEPAPRRRVRMRVRGAVQGVGFRPYVYRLARALGLDGFVRNDGEGVLIEVDGAAGAVTAFVKRLPLEAPPLARIERVGTEELAPAGSGEGFGIVASETSSTPTADVQPDAATCEECLRELFDPADRRFRYPFINCTSCGPRFTIVRGVPYDRPLTTMAGFRMCARCAAEYADPADRRFHAQPNACPECGPRARLVDAEARAVPVESARDAVEAAARRLLEGVVLAVKGLGGYHLACRADDQDAVSRLRARKHREDKPFAVMVSDLDAARRLVSLDDASAALLLARERPIVLAPRVPGAPVAEAVAPKHRDLGVMLAYTPLHHLLLADAGTSLVMTSGNLSDEPIAYRDEDALERLKGVADLFLLHDRPIETRTEDSVARAVRGRPVLLRRSRGFVPRPLPLPGGGPPMLACGAELKNTFALAHDGRAWLGPHIGNLESWEALRSYREGIDHLQRLLALEPEVIVHDLHPDYLSTKHALERAEATGARLIGVQHHHAHLAACLAEHEEAGPAVGAIFDGTGYGTDGTVWGGELLVGDLTGFERAGWLRTVRLPGGEAAIREPWRMACAWLVELLGPRAAPPPGLPVDPELWAAVRSLAASGVASPVTSSMGRLFDAVSALCGLRTRVTYEGQAAVELELALDPSASGAYEMPVLFSAGGLRLDAGPLVLAVLDDVGAGVPAGAISARFHRGLAAATIEACARVASDHGLDLVVLSGGVFQNATLLTLAASGLTRSGLRVLVTERVPPNDGGVAYGQAAVAAFGARTG